MALRTYSNKRRPSSVSVTPRGERSYDIYSRLLNDRIIILSEEVNSTTASLIVAQMLYLEAQDPEKVKILRCQGNIPGLGDLAEDAVKLQLDHLANPPDLKP